MDIQKLTPAQPRFVAGCEDCEKNPPKAKLPKWVAEEMEKTRPSQKWVIAFSIAWAALDHVAQWPEYDPRAKVARKAMRKIRGLEK